MKKWYRIFEIINSYPTVMKDIKWNWFETQEDAEAMLIEYNKKFGADILMILPVFEKVN